MALSQNVFTNNHSFLQSDLWKCDQSYKVEEINLYRKKVQFVSSILLESQRDIIVGATVCALGVILVYLC